MVVVVVVVVDDEYVFVVVVVVTEPPRGSNITCSLNPADGITPILKEADPP